MTRVTLKEEHWQDQLSLWIWSGLLEQVPGCPDSHTFPHPIFLVASWSSLSTQTALGGGGGEYTSNSTQNTQPNTLQPLMGTCIRGTGLNAVLKQASKQPHAASTRHHQHNLLNSTELILHGTCYHHQELLFFLPSPSLSSFPLIKAAQWSASQRKARPLPSGCQQLTGRYML